MQTTQNMHKTHRLDLIRILIKFHEAIPNGHTYSI